jgi:hypothetical protein
MRTVGKPWTERLVSVIRQYGVVFSKERFWIYYIKPSLPNGYEWKGCQMVETKNGSGAREGKVKLLIIWTNEMHG